MSFLNPMAIAIAAGLTIPPLIALYFLKLKRAVRLVPSTLLWKRAIEDLQVNAPFQRLRSSLLLLLQLLVLILAALALGRPMFQTVRTNKDNVIILVDQSASMGVIEANGVSRLERAKTEAKRCVENMDDDARAMVIAFCDRAWVVSSFDTDKKALMRKINSIEQTQSTSTLGEAMSLAEANTQNITIGGAEAGSDIAPEAPASPASVFLFTDGRIADAHQVALQKFDAANITVTRIGTRSDNVGIITMAARRGYERPESLEVTATVRNFAPEAINLDVVLYVGGRHLDVQTLSLKGADAPPNASDAMLGEPSVGSVRVVAFDQIEFGGAGIVEVVLQVDDALAADNHAWTIIEEPRSLRVLLVTEGNLFLENVLKVLPLDLQRMSPSEYERVDDDELIVGDRSAFDVVIMDQHSTERLPRGNYLFWASVPKMKGVAVAGVIDDQVIFNWDETHPLLRHVAVETLSVYEWLRLELPPEAVSIIDGETTPVLSYLTRDGSQYVISAFGLLAKNEFGTPLMNTYWVTSVDFVVFMQNAVTFLASNQATLGRKSVAPGDPVTLPLSRKVEVATVIRPDETRDSVLSAPRQLIHYARTRQVGAYRVEPGVPGNDQFAVNLFSEVEGDVSPAPRLTLGTSVVEAQASSIEVSRPAWPYFLIAILALLLFEWIVYNRRVLV